MVFPKRAAPHEVTSRPVTTIGDHAQVCLTEGCAVLINGDRVWYRFRASTFIIKVNKSPDLPVFQKPVSGIVVHSRIQADIFCGKRRHVLFQFMEGDKETDGIMPSGAGKAQEKRDIGFQLGVITRELEQGVAEIVFIQVTVPSPGSIGVREMPHVLGHTIPVVPAGAGMGMDSSDVSGNGEVFLRDQAALHGREDGGVVKKELEPLLKVKRDVFPIHQPFSNGFCNLRLWFQCFLFFAFRLFRLPAVP